MRGFEVVMTTGTDEHGVNVERAAKKAGVPESEFVARMADAWRALWDELGLSADEFVRTTDLHHVRTVQWLFKLFRENGYVYKGHYTGQYCIYDNAFVNDAKPGDNCPDCGRPTETLTEENYFFKLSAFQKPLLDFYKKNPDFIQPESRKNEIVTFVEGGLKDLSITRTTIRWGIPVPGPAKSRTFSTFGLTPSPLISAPSAAPTTKSAACGPRICIWLAKTSSASIPFTGPHS